MEVPFVAVGEDQLGKRVNKGVEYYQAGILRRLNYIDHVRVVNRAWSLSRILSQLILSSWPNKKLMLTNEIREYIDRRCADDWVFAKEFCCKV